ncbi:MAG: deoxyribose-phosphate aldolase [Kiritimatiellae bacterium]|nr:deoxyribose-phosphate aldolase [Kiritimatiellia bacterium]
MTRRELAGMIDHTFLKPDGDGNAVKDLCREVAEFGFACAMVHPCEVKNAVRFLRGTGCRVGTVIGFPLGQNTAKTKAAEAAEAVKNGARDVDFVFNRRLLKAAAAGNGTAQKELARELEALAEVKACADGVVAKIILECCELTDDEKIVACVAAKEAGFDFVKTSTGFGRGGATAEDVRLMREAVGPAMGVKAAGGIRDWETARALLAAGANRLGCSAGVKILQECDGIRA